MKKIKNGFMFIIFSVIITVSMTVNVFCAMPTTVDASGSSNSVTVKDGVATQIESVECFTENNNALSSVKEKIV